MNARKLITAALLTAFIACPAWAGTLDPPAGPDDPASAMHTMDGIYNLLDTGQDETKRAGAFAEPSAGPGDTGRTLDEVYAKAERLGYLVSRFVVVRAGADAAANGAQLLAAYAQAKSMTPAVDKRIGVFIGPGEYGLGTSELFLDTDFVDLYGLSVNRADQHIFGETTGLGSGVIRQTASDVRMENLLVECTRAAGGVTGLANDPAAYYPDAGAGNESPATTLIKNCEFKDDGAANSYSMRLYATYAGTYQDCTGGDASFGTAGTASGTFTNCTGGLASFGSNGTGSGTFTNCRGGDYSFGYNGTASGTFINCTGGEFSFGVRGTASGTFTNCTGESGFGSLGTASGTFTNCTGGGASFGAVGTGSGTFICSKGGANSFDGDNSEGVFDNCTVGGAPYAGAGIIVIPASVCP